LLQSNSIHSDAKKEDINIIKKILSYWVDYAVCILFEVHVTLRKYGTYCSVVMTPVPHTFFG